MEVVSVVVNVSFANRQVLGMAEAQTGSFLTAHQHIIGYSVPLMADCKTISTEE